MAKKQCFQIQYGCLDSTGTLYLGHCTGTPFNKNYCYAE